MRTLIRYFFRTLRLILGPFMLLWEKLSTPRGVKRLPEEQGKVDAQCRSLALYQFATCPFCIKARKAMAALSLNIEKRDAQFDPRHRQALQEGGGALKVPCLRITEADGSVTWLYESTAICQYLEKRFS